MIHGLKKKSKIGIAQKSRKKFKAFMPDPNADDEKPVNLEEIA